MPSYRAADLVAGHAFRRQIFSERLVACSRGRQPGTASSATSAASKPIAQAARSASLLLDLRRRAGFRRDVDRPRTADDLGFAGQRNSLMQGSCARIPVSATSRSSSMKFGWFGSLIDREILLVELEILVLDDVVEVEHVGGDGVQARRWSATAHCRRAWCAGYSPSPSRRRASTSRST